MSTPTYGAGGTNDLRELEAVETRPASNVEDSLTGDCPECLANQLAATRGIVDLVEGLDPPGGVGVELQLAHRSLLASACLSEQRLCQSGYMLMADVGAALTETHRVLRPGRRLALSVWGAPERNPWGSIGGRLLVERGHMPPPEPGRPGVFSLASEERVRALLEGAGFEQIRMDDVDVAFRFDDVDDYVRWAIDMAGPLAMVLRGLPQDELLAIAAQLEEDFRSVLGRGRVHAARRRPLRSGHAPFWVVHALAQMLIPASIA